MLSMNQRRTFLCTLLAACLSLAPGIRPAFAAGTPTATPSPDAGAPPVLGPGLNHPERHWKTFDTPHFEVHYYQGFEALARQAVEIAEASFARIAADIGVKPYEKLYLIITEDEFWNGFAEPLRNRIVLDPRFALEPTIGLPRFIVHEMTHILNFMGVENQIPFSKLMNAAGLPSWFAEGLAQYEAEYWAPEMDRLLRLHVLNRSLLTPAERNAFTVLGNRGGDGYNEGYSLVSYMFETYGHDRLKLLLDNYRNSTVSFDQAVEITFGKPMRVLEAEWRDQLEVRYRDQLQHRHETLDQARPVVAYKADRSWYLPQISPDGKWFTYFSTGGYPTIRGQIYNIMPLKAAPLKDFEAWGQQQQAKQDKEAPVADTQAPPSEPIPSQGPLEEFRARDVEIPDPQASPSAPPTTAPTAAPTSDPMPSTEPTARPSPGLPAPGEIKLEDIESELVHRLLDYRWRPDSQALALTTLKADKYGNSISSVQLQRLKTDETKLRTDGDPIELTPGVSSHSPAWSPSGKTLAVVVEENGHDAIALYDADTRTLLRKLLPAPDLRQYRWLSFSPDGRQLLMEVYLPGGSQHLLRYDLDQNLSEQLTQPPLHETDRQPFWAPDGQSIYFVSTRQGFADLWKLDLQKHEMERQSQVYTGIETPSLSPDGSSLYFARHHAEGTGLEKVAVTDLKTYDAFHASAGEAIFDQATSLTPVPKLAFEPKDYLPWLGLEVVVPVVGRDEKGDQLGALVQFSDLLQTHSLNLLFLYGLASARIGYSAAYINRFFDTSFGIEVGDSPELSFTTDGTQFFIVRDQHVTLFANRPVFNAGSGDTFATAVERNASLEFTVSRQTNLTDQLNGQISTQQLREGFNNTLSFTFSDNRARRKQSGFTYTLGLSGATKLWGSQYEFVQANADWRQYIPTWANQVLAYHLTGTAMTGDTRPAILGGPPLSNVLVLNFQNIVPLRGFHLAELQGPMLLAGSVEYRVPLLNPVTLNLGDHYIEDVSAAAFLDGGDAWYPSKRNPFPHLGVGLELRSDVILNRRNHFQLYLGAGKALLGEGDDFLRNRPVEFYGGFANTF